MYGFVDTAPCQTCPAAVHKSSGKTLITCQNMLVFADTHCFVLALNVLGYDKKLQKVVTTDELCFPHQCVIYESMVFPSRET